MDDPGGVPQLEAVQSHRKRALTGERGAQSGVSQRRRVVAVSPQYAYNRLLIRSEAGGRHLSNGKRELGEIPSSVVLRLSARAEQGVCLSALDERVCLVLGTKASKSSTRAGQCSSGVGGSPIVYARRCHRARFWLRRRHCSPGSAIALGDWTLPDGRKGRSRRISTI